MAQLHFGAGDSVAFGTSGTAVSGTASFTTSSLANIQVGDLLVAWIHSQTNQAGSTLTPPSGWTRYGAALATPDTTTSRISGFYYYPIKSSADVTALGATVTWTFSVSSGRVACVVARATGIDLDNIEDAASTTFSGGPGLSTTIAAITTVKATTLLVAGVHHQNSASTTSASVTSLLTAFQEYKTSPTGSANANTGAAMGYQDLTSAGSTGTVSATYDSSVAASGAELVAFKVGAWTPPVVPITRPIIMGAPTTYTISTAVTSFTINKPAGLQDGDVLILALSAQSPTITSDYACSGWTRISQPFIASSAGYRLIAFYALTVPTAASVSQSSFTFTSTDSVAGGRIAAEMFIVRGAELTNLTTAISPYGTTNSQTAFVQPGSPAVGNNLLLVAYNAQFTSAIDYTIASGPTGMTQQADIVNSTGAVSKTVLAVYQQDTEAGAVASKNLTWNGAQSQTTGVAIAIRGSGMVDPNPGVALKYTSATDTLSTGHLFYTSATDTLATPLEVRPVPTGYPSVTAMLATSPFYCAHRGGSADWPEMSLHAYTQSVFWGVGALELSLARTSDGVWFGLHDATLDRTSGTTGFTASAHTWAEVQAYAITSAGTSHTSLPAQPYMRWEELMAAYYSTHVIFVDPKNSAGNMTELLDMMDAMPGTPTDRFVAKYYGVTSGWPQAARGRGYKTWGYFYQADAANFDGYQGRWDILGMDYTANQATWTQILSYGKPVMGHIVPSSAAASTALNYGAAGLMVSGVQEAIPRTT